MYYFTSKFASLILAITAPTSLAQAATAARHELNELSAILFDQVNLAGAAFSPENLVQGVCNTLPCDWLDRAESAQIGPGFSCFFFQHRNCAGSGILLNGTINSLPMPSLFNNTESFFCGKDV